MSVQDVDIHRAVVGWLVEPAPHTLANAGDDATWQAAKRCVVVHGVGAILGARGAAAFPDAPAWFSAFLAEQQAFCAARVSRLLSESYGLRAAADRFRSHRECRAGIYNPARGSVQFVRPTVPWIPPVADWVVTRR